MVRLLEQPEDLLETELDEAMTAEEEAAERRNLVAPFEPVDDLKEGKGNRITKGRAMARRAWMWNGTPTVLPIAWNPEGTKQDGGRAYMRKRHCTCCNICSGFKGSCPRCIKNNCGRCAVGTDRTKVIPCYYLRKDQVPQEWQWKFYGPVDCFQRECPRKNGMGFATDEDMRMHARSTHRMEYASRQESLAAAKADETADLRKRLDDLTSLMLRNGQATPAMTVTAVADAPPGRTAAQKESDRKLGLAAKARVARAKARVAREAT